jgi:tetratricopeptide (TPR) repeat protein
MTETSLQSSARFCSSCGKPVVRDAVFCSACGRRVVSRQDVPAVGDSRPSARLAGLVVLVGFLTVGLALWVAVLAPGKAPGRVPLAQKPVEQSVMPEATSGGTLPANHPPLEIPADAKRYITELEEKAAARPKDLAAWKTVAEVEYRAGQIDRGYLDKALTSFRHALEIDAHDLEALRGIGNVHFDHEQYAEAVDSYSRYLALKPDDLNVRTDLGTMYLYGGKPDKAIAEYGKVLAADPKFYQAQYNLGIAYAQTGDAPKALEALGRARSLAPDERTRAEIQAMIDRAEGRGGASSTTAATEPKSFQSLVEAGLRNHSIVGPKIVRFEWSSATAGRVRLRDFPMQGMPEMVRTKFLDHLQGELANAKRESGVAGAGELALVDDPSGQVMATISTK